MTNRLAVFVIISFAAAHSYQDEKACTNSSECPEDLSCIGLKCEDPCESSCGQYTVCTVSNHNATCSCMPGFTPGYDIDVRSVLTEDITDCVPMTCTINSDCPEELGCFYQKCSDPCPILCGKNTICKAVDHNATCTCKPGFTGGYDIDVRTNTDEEKFTNCVPIRSPECTSNADCPENKACMNETCGDPCSTANCGPNTVCQTHNKMAMCSCMPSSTGDPISGCRLRPSPECTSNVQCAMNKACMNETCGDPCSVANCGPNTVCQTHKNMPMCSCMPGSTGDPISGCRLGRDQGSEEPLPKKKKFFVETSIKATWQGALVHCQNQGRQLASIESSEENTEVLQLIKQTNINLKNFWIAGTDGAQEGQWVWFTTGKSLSGFSYWQRGQPDNLFNEDCLGYLQLPVLGLIMKSGYWWNDYHCSWSSYFICEYYE